MKTAREIELEQTIAAERELSRKLQYQIDELDRTANEERVRAEKAEADLILEREERERTWNRMKIAQDIIKQLKEIIKKADDLYARVEMDESIGMSLSSRCESLSYRDIRYTLPEEL